MIAVHSNPSSMMLRVAALALTIFVFSDGGGNAQSRATQGLAPSEGPFGQLAGAGPVPGPSICPVVGASRSNAERPMTC